MIVKMSKVEMIGPKDQLLEVLDLLRGKGVFQPEADVNGYVPHEDELRIRSLLLSDGDISEKLFLEKLKGQIVEIVS